MLLPEPADDAHHRRSPCIVTGDRPFSAVHDRYPNLRRPDRLGCRSALRTPLATRAVMFGIKRHGITLYLKGLRP